MSIAKKLSKQRENLSEKRARAQVIDVQVADAQKRLDSAQTQATELQHVFEELSKQHEHLQEQETFARNSLNTLVVKRDQGRSNLDAAREAYTHASAERTALEELERASESANPLLAHVLDSRANLAPDSKVLSHVIKAPSKFDGLLEMLLGDDVYALITSKASEAISLGRQALDCQAYGAASIFTCEHSAAFSNKENLSKDSLEEYRPEKGSRLIDELEIDPKYRALLETFLGDVYVVDTLADALEAQRQDTKASHRFVSLDGAIVYPQGKIGVSRKSEEDQKNSALSRRRTLDQARQTERDLQETYERIQAENKTLEEELRKAQTESLKLTEALASSKGRCESAERDAIQSAQSVAEFEKELTELLREQQANEAFLAKAQPDSDELEKELAEVLAKLELNKEEVSQVEKSLSPLRRTIVSLSEKLSDARLESARLSERLAYALRMEQTRSQEISSSTKEDERAYRRIAIARGASQRADALLATLASLSDAASLVSLRLEQESQTEQNASRELHDNIAKATQTSREVRERFDGCSAKLAEVRIEKGRLEIQVDAGIKAIVEDCDTSLEQALSLEALQDRSVVEEHCASLERRIKNMGSGI